MNPIPTFEDVKTTTGFDSFVPVEKEIKDFNPYINMFNQEIVDKEKFNSFNKKFEANVRKKFASGEGIVSFEEIFKLIERNEENNKKLENIASESKNEVEEKFRKSSKKSISLKEREFSLENEPLTISTTNSPVHNDSESDSIDKEIPKDDSFFNSKKPKIDQKEIDKKRNSEIGKKHKSSKRAIFEFNKYSIISIAGLIFTGVGLYVASKPLLILGIVVVLGTLAWKCFDIFLSNFLVYKPQN